MASYTKGGATLAAFGNNEILYSGKQCEYDSRTVYAASVANETIDGFVQKVLAKGEVLAKITSGPGTGLFGPFQTGATDGRQTAANIVGINGTFLPWQLMEHDCEVANLYSGTVRQAWCYERDSGGVRIPLATAGVLTALQVNATNRQLRIALA
jgi:hypothetical protein